MCSVWVMRLLAVHDGVLAAFTCSSRALTITSLSSHAPIFLQECQSEDGPGDHLGYSVE